jgi:RNA polymerase sigma factor (sigma-70 family)
MCRSVSNRPNYEGIFEGWEIAIAKALVEQFCWWGETFSGDDFDDLQQEVLIHWLFRRDGYDPARDASPSTFMRTVVLNKLIDLQRARNAHKEKALDEATPLDEPPHDDEDAPTLAETIKDPRALSEEAMNLRIKLLQAIQALSPRQRRICELILSGSDKTQISQELSVHRSTVHDDIRRIRKLFESAGLKEYLE